MTSVLIVRLSAMGDLVQGLGAVAALHRARPDWRLTFVTQLAWAALLEQVPGIHRVVAFDRAGGLRGLRRLRQELRKDRYDIALDLQGNWKSAGVAWLSQARRRVGMSSASRQEGSSRLLLHEVVTSQGPAHPAHNAWLLVRSIAPEAPFLLPRLTATAAEVARERQALEVAGIDWQHPFRVVVVTDPEDPRALRPAVIAAETQAAAGPVVHLCGPDEAHLVAVGPAATLRHGREPRRLIALGVIVAEAGGVVVGPDQGATHVLAAAGAPCRVWFGAQDPRRTAPPAATALVHPESPPCRPCGQKRCGHPGGPVCMEFNSAQGRVVDLGLPVESGAT